ncbi:discoidin domain-containing protein [Bifidobacterium tsurumiense]|uniref:discoidin domain-containing protein n=1 Tax=Bifidobacterium tsurumiense TaxID=356829 RepID=UPI0018A6B517|nr:discoidin domain-containing protein [Bifidobacterium tsurumiense]
MVTALGTEVDDRMGPELTADGNGMPENGSQPSVHNAIGASRWSANRADNVWIAYDLRASASLKSVDIAWGNTFGTDYNIGVSNDGQSWTNVLTGLTGERASTVSHQPPDGTQGRYMKTRHSQNLSSGRFPFGK